MATAKQIMEMLGLKPHPTCGFVAETYRSKQQIPQQALPAVYEGSRPFGSVLYFMVTLEAQITCTASAPTRCTTTTSATRWRCYCYTRAGAVR
jgi:predicted cupin superfamily sugar epimerase